MGPVFEICATGSSCNGRRATLALFVLPRRVLSANDAAANFEKDLVAAFPELAGKLHET